MPERTRRRIVLVLALTLAIMLPVSLSGQSGSTTPAEVSDAAATIDFDALRSMSREDRRAALQALSHDQRRAYRQALKAWRLAEADVALEPQGYKPLAEPRPVSERAVDVAGTTIQYDSGTVTGFYTASDLGRMVGNRYDSALNAAATAIAPVETTGTVTMITFDMLRTGIFGLIWSLYDDIMGTTAPKVTSASLTTYATGLNTYTIMAANTPNNVYQNGTFLAGIFQFSVATTRLGVDTGTNGGQGIHGIEINDQTTMGGGTTGTDLMTISNLNAVFRVSGNVATPVELMSFELE